MIEELQADNARKRTPLSATSSSPPTNLSTTPLLMNQVKFYIILTSFVWLTFSILYLQNNLFEEQEDGSEEEEDDAGLLKSLKNQVKYYMLLTSCIWLTSILFRLCRIIYLTNKEIVARRRKRMLMLDYHHPTKTRRRRRRIAHWCMIIAF